MDLKEEAILGDDVGSHWYYRSKSRALLRYLKHIRPVRILDVGAGSGFFSKKLLQQTGAREAICVDTSYLSDKEVTIGGRPVRFVSQCGAVEVDLVLMMDVLEHVGDDLGMLRDYVEKVPSGCIFVVTVPAFEFLWSGHDVFLEHKRRYTLPQIEAVVRAAGLEVHAASYYFGLVFPIAAALRLTERVLHKSDHAPRSQLRPHSRITNRILRALCSAELPFMKLNRLAGLTAFCLAVKPPGQERSSPS